MAERSPGGHRGVTSIRGRVTAAASVAALAVLVVTSVGLLAVHRRGLTNALDEAISAAESGAAERVRAGVPLDPLPSVVDDDGFVQVVGPRGDVVSASAGALERDPVVPPPQGQRQWRTTFVPFDGSRFRVLSTRASSPDGPVTIHVGAPLDDVDDSVGLLLRSLAAAVPATSALLALVVWVLVGRTLQPVESIRQQVRAISGSDLSRRVSEPAADDEIGRLARTMNDMLARLESAADEQRRFAADASHELRSPLTRMRAELEVDLAHPGRADPLATHRSLLEELTALEGLVSDLLLLARVDADAPVAAPEPVPVSELIEEMTARVAAAGLDGPVTEVGPASLVGLSVDGDRNQLRRLLGNVVDNAIRHARHRVGFEVATEGPDVLIAVADDGPGVPDADRERIFERFARGDEARSAGGGTGLGLAIARQIARRHRGTVSLDGASPGARFVIRLPLSPR